MIAVVSASTVAIAGRRLPTRANRRNDDYRASARQATRPKRAARMPMIFLGITGQSRRRSRSHNIALSYHAAMPRVNSMVAHTWAKSLLLPSAI